MLYRVDDQPAIIRADGTKEWYKDGVLHRGNNKPAIEGIGKKWFRAWYKNGILHRDNDKPAVITIFGKNKMCQEWYVNGLRHRNNKQPAILEHTGNNYWYENGINITKKIKEEKIDKMSKKRNKQYLKYHAK